MEERQIKKNHNQKIVKKRVYTSPVLIVYGKLAELTTGGGGTNVESGVMNTKRP